jgi:hypothetical protein
VYVHRYGKFHKTGGTIFGLAPAAEAVWLDVEYQNYYRKMIHKSNDIPPNDPKNIYVDFNDEGDRETNEFVIGRGFAVYYNYFDINEENGEATNEPRYRNVTAGSGDDMHTGEDNAAHWVSGYYDPDA